MSLPHVNPPAKDAPSAAPGETASSLTRVTDGCLLTREQMRDKLRDLTPSDVTTVTLESAAYGAVSPVIVGAAAMARPWRLPSSRVVAGFDGAEVNPCDEAPAFGALMFYNADDFRDQRGCVAAVWISVLFHFDVGHQVSVLSSSREAAQNELDEFANQYLEFGCDDCRSAD